MQPNEYILSQNYPNPFNPSTTIRFTLPEKAHVKLVIYNVMGQRIRTLIDAEKKADTYRTTWDGRDSFGNLVATGVYFYQLDTKNSVITKKMLLIK
jgi:flagellar hook assembly protein FlgD